MPKPRAPRPPHRVEPCGAADLLAERRPGSSLDYLIGLLPDAPADLGARHDEYLAQGLQGEVDRLR